MSIILDLSGPIPRAQLLRPSEKRLRPSTALTAPSVRLQPASRITQSPFEGARPELPEVRGARLLE
eukprot:4484895-Alexandrium_andersonii.AAC.1